MLPQAIRATAGLLYWFARETNLLPEPFTINISRVFEFDQTENLLPQNSYGCNITISSPNTIIKNNRQYTFVCWSDGNTSNPRTITPQGNETYTAIYKYPNHSNDINAFANNSQRKIVTTTYDGNFMVYTSSNHIWLENGYGTDWTLVGNGPVDDISDGLEARSPSIDYCSNPSSYESEIYIIYQQKTPNGKYKIKLAKYNENGQKVFNLDVFSSTKDYATFDATPIIAVTRTYGLANNKPKITMVWRQQAEGSYQNGLYYYGAIDNGNDVTLYYLSPQKFTSTDVQSSNPTIAVYKNPYGVILNHVA